MSLATSRGPQSVLWGGTSVEINKFLFLDREDHKVFFGGHVCRNKQIFISRLGTFKITPGGHGLLEPQSRGLQLRKSRESLS